MRPEFLILLGFCLWFAAPGAAADYGRFLPKTVYDHVMVETYQATPKGTVPLIGFHFDTEIQAPWFYSLAIYGAIGGDSGGYGKAGIGLKWQTELTPDFILDTQCIIGSGGGGGLPAGGGLFGLWTAGCAAAVLKNFFIEARAGYLTYPNGPMVTPVVTIGVMERWWRMIARD